MRDRRGWLGAIFVVTAGLAGAYWPARAAEITARFEFVEPHIGTRFRIILYAADEATAKRASAAAFKRIAELDGIMSDYQPTSELMRLCAKAGGDAVPVSADLFAVLSRSQEISRKTDGAFDATVGPVMSNVKPHDRIERQLPPTRNSRSMSNDRDPR